MTEFFYDSYAIIELGMIDEILNESIPIYIPEKQNAHDADLKGLSEAIYRSFNVEIGFDGILTAIESFRGWTLGFIANEDPTEVYGWLI